MKALLALSLLFLSSCGSIREYSNKELTLEYEVEAPGKSKNQIYSHSSIWISGPAGLYDTKSNGNSKGEGRLVRDIRFDRNISPLNNDVVQFNLTMIIHDETISLTFSNPRIYKKSWFFPMGYSKLNMKEEFAGYKGIADEMVAEYREYIGAAKHNPNFEKDSISITGATIE